MAWRQLLKPQKTADAIGVTVTPLTAGLLGKWSSQWRMQIRQANFLFSPVTD
jgi:hypothetical protein